MSISQEYEIIRREIGEEKFQALEKYLEAYTEVFLSDVYYKESEWEKFEEWLWWREAQKKARGSNLCLADNILDSIDFGDLITAVMCNRKIINASEIYEEFEELIKYRIMDAKNALIDDMSEIIKEIEEQKSNGVKLILEEYKR